MKAIRSCRLPCENNRSHVLECQEPSWSSVTPKVFVFFAVEGCADPLGMPSTLLCTTASLWALVISCQNRTYTHTHDDNEKLNGCFEILHARVLPLMHHAHRTQTANAHPPPTAASCLTLHASWSSKSKTAQWNEKTRGGSVWCTHYTAWHII